MQSNIIRLATRNSRANLSSSAILRTDHGNNAHPYSQAKASGKSSAEKSGLDAANRNQSGSKQASNDASGNREKVGFAEQVGGASGDKVNKHWEGKGGSQEATPPGFLDSVKSALGFKTTSGEVKQNRGGGIGVEGTGTGTQSPPKNTREFHTSSVAQTEGTKGQAPDSSRQTKDDSVRGDQNPHLAHKDPKEKDSGKGNAAPNPTLPSHQTTSSSGQRRSFSTSAFWSSEKSPADRVHNRESDKAQKSADKAYQTVDAEEPYGGQDNLRYGGKENFSNESDKGADHPKDNTGPDGEAAGGRKPERR